MSCDRCLTDDARLVDAPRGDVLIGLPSTLVESIVSEALAGPLRNVRLSLKDVVKVERSDEVQSKTFLGTMTLGRYDLTVNVQEVNAVMKPRTPILTFGSNRIAIDLPVSVEAGERQGEALLQVGRPEPGRRGLRRSDRGARPARLGAPGPRAPPRPIRRGGARASSSIVKPRIAPIEVAFHVEPLQRTWDFVDDLIGSKNAVCEAALRKAEVGQKVKDLVSRGFKVTVPTNWLHAMALPASFRDTVDVQGTSAGLVDHADRGFDHEDADLVRGEASRSERGAPTFPQHSEPSVKKKVAPDPRPGDSVQMLPAMGFHDAPGQRESRPRCPRLSGRASRRC